jgi:peptidoglycan/LPS O-acetylase OafA/YrhL
MVTALRFLSLTQNLIAPMPADYYFAVTWPLTIEEWFYLLFGASLIALSQRFGGSRALPWCLAAFMLAPLALRVAYAERGVLVFFRIEEIAYGVLAARLYLGRSRLFSHPWACLAAGQALIAAALAGALPIPDSVAVALTPNAQVIGSALCLPTALHLIRAVWWFERPIRWIAEWSCALYLMHLTILADVVETQLLEPGMLSAPVCVAVAMVLPFPLAELSYRFLEAPLLRHRPRQGEAGAGWLLGKPVVGGERLPAG